MTWMKGVCMWGTVREEVDVRADWTVWPLGPPSPLMLKLILGVFADVGGISRSSSSVNMNRLWHPVRSLLLSGDEKSGTCKRSERGLRAPRGTMVQEKERKDRGSYRQTCIYTWPHVYSHRSHIHLKRMDWDGSFSQAVFNLNSHRSCFLSRSMTEQIFDFSSLLLSLYASHASPRELLSVTTVICLTQCPFEMKHGSVEGQQESGQNEFTYMRLVLNWGFEKQSWWRTV